MRARCARSSSGREELRDERPVRGRYRVEADIDRCAEEREREVRGRSAECDREKPTGRHQAPAEYERKPTPSATHPTTVAPVPDHERDREARCSVDEHYKPDQARRALDVVEEDREVRRRDRPPCSGTDRCRGKRRQVEHLAPPPWNRPRCDRQICDGHGLTTAKAAGATCSVTGPVPRFVVSAMTGELPLVPTHTLRAVHIRVPSLLPCEPRRSCTIVGRI